MSYKQKNSFLLLEILICFFLLALAFPLMYPTFQARRLQVHQWKQLRALQEQAELSFLETRLKLEEPEVLNRLTQAKGEAFFIPIPPIDSSPLPLQIQLQEQFEDKKGKWIQMLLEYPGLQNKESIQFRQIYYLKKK